ncbi:hypothetical protein FBY28_2610 [Arthrobacter sp. SLBN-53]|nr:hypothetical protein FBY28_2610 [Arthrobacter sp. SLBN-53]
MTTAKSKDDNLVRDLRHTNGIRSDRTVRRRTLLKVPLLAAPVAAALPATPTASAAVAGRWSTDRAHRWFRAQGWLVGANYITSNAINQLEMFQAKTFDPARIDNELRMARSIGLNTVRVFLHDQLWTQDRVGFHRRLGQFVDIAAKHGIRPLLVLFDSCWDPLPRSGPQRAPTRGVHNSGWVQSPGAERLDDRRYRQVLQEYVIRVISQFRNDNRVLGWDLWNEPDNPAAVYAKTERKDKPELVAELLPQVFRWARTVDPVQPLTTGVWEGEWRDAARRSEMASIQLDLADVLSFHSYDNPAGFERRIEELQPWGRPMMCTEYLARTEGSTIEGVLPVAKRRHVGAYTWGLVAGKTQTYLPWDSWDKPYLDPPREWFHDLIFDDGWPYRPREIDTLRSLTGSP